MVLEHESAVSPCLHAAYLVCGERLRRAEGEDHFIDDLEPYPPNARPGVARSMYD
jgi:hypothetical protein